MNRVRALMPTILRTGGTALLLWLALRKVPAGVLQSSFKAPSPMFVAFSVLVMVVGVSLTEAGRYATYGRALADQPPLPFRQWLWIYLASRPWFYILPAAAGAEACVWSSLRSEGWDHQACASLVLINRVLGMGAWALVLAWAMFAAPGSWAVFGRRLAFLGSPWPWVALGVGTVLGCAVVFFRHARAPFRHFLPMFLANLGVTALGVAVFAVSNWLSAKGAGLEITTLQGLGLIAALNFGMALPISMGGFGLQESMLLLLAPSMGVPVTPMLCFSATLHLRRIVLSVVGGVAFLAVRKECKQAEGVIVEALAP